MTAAADTPFAAAARRVSEGADHHAEAAVLVASMTDEERLWCLDGDTEFWSGIIDMVSGGYHTRTRGRPRPSIVSAYPASASPMVPAGA